MGANKTRDRHNATFVKCSFLLALLIYTAINIGLSFSPQLFNQYKFPYRGWAWWTINDLKSQPEIHNVALLGSSLMITAVAGCDANYLHHDLDLTNYHKAQYFDHLLRTRFGGTFNSYNLAAPGEMPSDAYLTLQAMSNTAHRPDIVIYGIAPRDFIDSTLNDPADTEPFRYMRRLVNIDDVAGKYFRSPASKLAYFLERNIYLYGYAPDFQMRVNRWVSKALAEVVPRPYTQHMFTWWDRVKLLPGYMPGEVYPKAVVTGPVDYQTATHTYVDNTEEYLERYHSPNPKTYRTQVFFLKKLISYCHKERIQLVMVNMPITLYNASMLRPGIYMKYLGSMQKITFESGVPFYDMSDFNKYPQTDFHDCVHLNAFGGKKFFDNLVERLAADQISSSAMTMAGQELKNQQMLAGASHRIY